MKKSAQDNCDTLSLQMVTSPNESRLVNDKILPLLGRVESGESKTISYIYLLNLTAVRVVTSYITEYMKLTFVSFLFKLSGHSTGCLNHQQTANESGL